MKARARTGATCVSLLVVAGSLGVQGCTYLTKGHAEFDLGIKERGTASWYGADFHGLVTASGEVYDMFAPTAAHRSLPLGSVVTVVNLGNGRRVTVKVTDRGPYKRGRIIDLSYGAAERLDMVRAGVAVVQLEVVASDASERRRSVPTTRPAELSSPPQARFGLRRAAPTTLAKVRPRRRPDDVRRFPRVRRVADILLAEHTVYATTAGLTTP